MDNSKLPWTVELGQVEVLQERGDAPNRERAVVFALAGFFAQLGKEVNVINSYSLFTESVTGRRLLIILSNDLDALKNYFEQLIMAAYSDKDTDFVKQRYLFVETGAAPDRLFDVLSLIFESLKIGKRVKIWDLFPALELLDEEGEASCRLRDKIEEICFASGMEEMCEFFFRDPVMFHDIFKYVREENKSAVRLIIGAYLAGEINFSTLKKVLTEFGKPRGGIYEIEKILLKFTADVNRIKEKVEDKFKNPLWNYVEGKKILLIEDRIGKEEEGWDMVLPAILMSPESYEDAANGQELSKIFSTLVKNTDSRFELRHCNTIDEALNRDREDKSFNLKEFDIILLDLYSSAPHQRITLPVNTKNPMRLLFEKLDSFDKEQVVPQLVPHVIIFSQDSTGITARTMFNEFKAADYFFKNSEYETHKSGYYSSFRNAIITALKESVLHVAALTAREGRRKFDRWLRQFEPCDRPSVLHLMKHFKYFSSSTIVDLFNIYLNLECKKRGEGDAVTISILGSQFRKPNRFFISYLGRPNKSGPATVPLLSKTPWFQNLKSFIKSTDREKLPKFLSYDDLQQELIADILVKEANEDHVCLIFIDDFVGSGSQIKDYIPKFVNTHLKEVCQSVFTKALKKNEIWQRLKVAFEKEQKNGIKSLEIHVLFALGVNNKDIEALIKPLKFLDAPGYPNIRPIKGEVTFVPGEEPENDTKEGREEKKVEDITVKANVHVANFTQSVQEILKNDEEIEKIKKVLWKYSVITELRAEDYACDFEPIGWEKNGGLTATYANAQGNTIPVVWHDFSPENILRTEDYIPPIKEWESLYTRYFNPLTQEKKTKKGKQEQKKKKEKIEKLPCYKNRECELNPTAWNKVSLLTDEYWEKYEDPPCKLNQIEMDKILKSKNPEVH